MKVFCKYCPNYWIREDECLHPSNSEIVDYTHIEPIAKVKSKPEEINKNNDCPYRLQEIEKLKIKVVGPIVLILGLMAFILLIVNFLPRWLG